MINAGEIMGGMMLSLHNITYLNRLMSEMRKSIIGDYFTDFVEEFYRKTADTYKRY